jgi:hypothetical protein
VVRVVRCEVGTDNCVRVSAADRGKAVRVPGSDGVRWRRQEWIEIGGADCGLDILVVARVRRPRSSYQVLLRSGTRGFDLATLVLGSAEDMKMAEGHLKEMR